MTPAKQGIIALILANIIWGAASPIFKLALTNIPPFTLAFLRFFIASILLAIVLRKSLAYPIRTKKDFLLLLGYALFGIVLNIIFFFLGLEHTLAMNAPVIISSQPIMTFLFSALFLHEPIRKKKIAGVTVGFMGILVIILEPLLLQGLDGSIEGNLYLILATACAALSTIIGHRIFSRLNPLTVLFYAFIVSTALLCPFAALEYTKTPLLYAQLDIRGIGGILFGSVFSSLVAYSAFSWGLSKIKATDASLFAYVDPIAGTILSYFLLHEPITVPFIVGTFLIFLGIYIAERRINYHPILALLSGKKQQLHQTVAGVLEKSGS